VKQSENVKMKLWLTMASLMVSSMATSASTRAKHVQWFRSPDGALRVSVRSVSQDCPETRLTISSTTKGIIYRKDFSSSDCEHGSSFIRGEWTPDSGFFVFSIESTGGHQPGHKPVLFYNRVESTLYRLEDFIGYIVAQDFSLKAPHNLQTEKQLSTGSADGIRIEVDLSRVGRRMRRAT